MNDTTSRTPYSWRLLVIKGRKNVIEIFQKGWKFQIPSISKWKFHILLKILKRVGAVLAVTRRCILILLQSCFLKNCDAVHELFTAAFRVCTRHSDRGTAITSFLPVAPFGGRNGKAYASYIPTSNPTPSSVPEIIATTDRIKSFYFFPIRKKKKR